ncbi:FAD-dependent oxidoreductase [Chromatiales bacterium (ex Bugula neritina AB1)]|nr:FAD-dependent oxidoreductase [Chromatiales bacterium (ex Bugula neritina AB1)]
MQKHYDMAVIGAGIAGASVAARLADAGKKVVLLEMETQPGYHTTGRSAAVYAPSYGPAPIRALTRASENFFVSPPHGFADCGLFSPRLIMMIARTEQQHSLRQLCDEASVAGSISVIDESELRKTNPLVRAGYAAAAMLDRAGQDIDVSALHQGFLGMFKAASGELLTNAAVTALRRSSDHWVLESKAGQVHAQIVVNASGAWADLIGTMAGAESIGLVPKRRTAALIKTPEQFDATHYPITIDIDEQFYLKPDAGRLLISPADETPVNPCDAQPEELDIAVCVDRIEAAFDLQIQSIESKWAGLRSFVTDKSPVAGFSAQVEGFYWLAGQGGYGIQTSPALSDLAAAQILGRQAPSYILDQGFRPADLAPERQMP